MEPWSYIASIGFSIYLNPTTYGSLPEITTAIQSALTNNGFCTAAYSGITYDQPTVWGYYSPTYWLGVDVTHQHVVDFDVTANVGCATAWTAHPAILQSRTGGCPVNYELIYETSPSVVGPYCALQWSLEDEDKQVGGCVEGSLLKGNPCDVGSGNKYQVERDYVAPGSFPLTFIRHYNSLYAKNYPCCSSTPPRWEPIGAGWSANYLQKINYSAYGTAGTAIVERPDGKRIAFNASGSDFVGPLDMTLQLTAQRNGLGVLTGWTLINEHDETETYDAAGKFLSIANRAGVTHLAAYDSLGHLATVTDSFGRQLQFSFNDKSQLVEITDPDGGTVEYTYDSSRNLNTVTYQDSEVREYKYEIGGNFLTGIVDEKVNRYSTYAYASYPYSPYAISTELAGGVNKYQISRSGSSRTVVDPLGKSRTYGTSVVFNVSRVTSSTSVCQGCGEAKALTYDANANVTVRKDFNNIETRYSYNTARNLETSRTEAYGTGDARTITTTWHSTFRLPTEVVEPNRTTTFDYDGDGNLIEKVITDTAASPDVSRTWEYTYNGYGQVLTIDGPRTDVSDVTTYTYYNCATGDECGQIETTTNALGHVTTFDTYNAHGQPTQVTDANGLVTTLTYDDRLRMTSRTVGTEATTFDYDDAGLLERVTLPDASYLAYTYDNAHRLTRTDDSEGNYIVYTLDNMGNRTENQTYDPTNYLVRQQYRVFNDLNQLWKEIGSANTFYVTTEFGYDSNGNQTAMEAPESRDSGYTYDGLNRLLQITDPGTDTTDFAYDANDNLISVTDPRSKVTSYEYNGFGDLTQQVSPDTGTTTYDHDEAGNVAARTDARSETGTSTYDALNRLTELEFGDETIAYTYDTGTNNKGRLMEVEDNSGTTAWTYNSMGRVTGKAQDMGVTKAVGYGYNGDGQLTTITTPSGQTLTYSYTNNRITGIVLNSVTTLITDVTYDPFGPVNGWEWGNSTLAVRTQDLDGLVTAIDSAGLYDYAYDDAFRITGIDDDDDSNRSWTLAYDAKDQLTSASKTGLSQTWTYDANGNRTAQGGTVSSTFTVSGSSNRLSSVSGGLTRTYTYDSAGNTTAYSSLTFTYSDSGRMTAVSGGAGATYAVNALGQRVKKVTGGNTTYFVYDEAGHLIGEYNGAGNLIQETVWLDDIPVVTLRPNGGGVSVYYVHTDHLNTPRRISRPSDNVILWRWDSDPFGSTAANQDPDADSANFVYNLRFPGQYYDSETGLHYNYFRDYDSQMGRYAQSDPIGLDGGINTFSYVQSNPMWIADALGLAPGDKFNSEAAAAEDMAQWQRAIDDHNGWNWQKLVLGLFGESDGALIPIGPYQIGCEWTWDTVTPAIGFPPLPAKIGPSGKPMINIVKHATRKRAKDAARQEGRRAPMNHPSPARGEQHYHPVDAAGNKIPGAHHEYPK